MTHFAPNSAFASWVNGCYKHSAPTELVFKHALKDLNYPKSLTEIIITDGMSTDDTLKIATFYNVKLVKNKKISIATGRNLGFAFSSGELIAFTDADCVVDKNWIKNSIKYFDNPSVPKPFLMRGISIKKPVSSLVMFIQFP